MTAIDTRAGVSWLSVLGTLVAGTVGFAIGFYLGLFVILSIWGLDGTGIVYSILTMGFGTLIAGLAMAATAPPMHRRLRVLGSALVVGALALGVVLAIDGDFEALWVGGIVIVVVTTTLARTGPFRQPT